MSQDRLQWSPLELSAALTGREGVRDSSSYSGYGQRRCAGRRSARASTRTSRNPGVLENEKKRIAHYRRQETLRRSIGCNWGRGLCSCAPFGHDVRQARATNFGCCQQSLGVALFRGELHSHLPTPAPTAVMPQRRTLRRRERAESSIRAVGRQVGGSCRIRHDPSRLKGGLLDRQPSRRGLEQTNEPFASRRGVSRYLGQSSKETDHRAEHDGCGENRGK